jgi:transposase
MPSTHRLYAEWTPQRIIEWATQNGPATGQLVREIMNRRRYPEQGFRSCLGILKLSKIAGAERLELAARRALTLNALSYKHIKLILKNKLEQQPLPEKPTQLSIVHDNLRGASAFTSTTTNQ